MSHSRRILCSLSLIGFALPALAQFPGAPRVELPDGEGKALVESICVACHQTNQITGSAGYDQAGWRHLFSQMISLPDATAETISSYLASHFPATGARSPTLVPGDLNVEFKEWTVPTLGQRPRDPLQREDGTIWWAGMFASLIGRLDPATGEMREYRLDADAHCVDDLAR